MTQEDKELLLKDLCARLPYGVFCNMGLDYPLLLQRLFVDRLDGILLDFYEDGNNYQVYLSEVKPYLRPRSEIANLISAKEFTQLSGIDLIDWYNANHIDYRTDDEGKTMIEKGLALEAPKDMYK